MTDPAEIARGPWWRLKPGLKGLKKFMPDWAVKRATENGYGWERHYEPVCSDCPRLSQHIKEADDAA